MHWKTTQLTRRALGLAVAAVALVALSVSFFILASRLEGVQLVLILGAEAAFILSAICALAGCVVGIAAQRREGGWRPAVAIVLSTSLLIGAGLELVLVITAAAAGA